MILEGEAVAEIGGIGNALTAGDTTWIPATMPHRFLNDGDRPVRIAWTNGSVDATCTMVATGIEQTVDAEHDAARRR